VSERQARYQAGKQAIAHPKFSKNV